VRIIRYVGHPSPFDDPNIRRRLARQSMPPDVALAMSHFEHNRRISVRRGASVYNVGRAEGFSRQYTWGPIHFDVEMDDADWKRLDRDPIHRFMFLDVTNGVPPARPPLTPQDWVSLLRAVEKSRPPQVMMGLGV